MGVIPSTVKQNNKKRLLFPRYGGYSGQLDYLEPKQAVVSPLWGLFPY